MHFKQKLNCRHECMHDTIDGMYPMADKFGKHQYIWHVGYYKDCLAIKKC